MDNEKLIIIDREDSINGGSYTRITFRLDSFLYMLHGVTSTIDHFMSQQYEDLKLALAYSGPDKCQWNILYQNLDIKMHQTIICYRTPFPSICDAFYPDIESDGYLYRSLFHHISDHMKRKFLYQKLYWCLKNYQEKQRLVYTTLNECIDSYLTEHQPTEEEIKSDIEVLRKIKPDELKTLLRRYVWLEPEDFAMPKEEDSDLTWEKKTWNGPVSVVGYHIWTDGDNVYYSKGGNQFVLNKSNSTWVEKTWNGLSSFRGEYIWTDGENIYYSDGSTQYVLNKSTSTWKEKTWSGLMSLYALNIWTDGDNVYFSSGSNQYVLDRSTSAWSIKTWNGLIPTLADDIWSDGDYIYYSYDDKQYVLDKSTSTWKEKTWNGLASFGGQYVWTDGTNFYYSYGSTHYVLDKSTSTWKEKTWNGLTSFHVSGIWTDGDHIYYSLGSTQYVLDKSTPT